MKMAFALTAFGAISLFMLTGCGGSTPTAISDAESTPRALPAFIDENDNGVNDYLERTRHEGNGHFFSDADHDGICDFAQDGSNSWHGPGFIDSDRDGTCDYWQDGSPLQDRHHGLLYRDRNRNRVNDYQEPFEHSGGGHVFTDEDGDGICDFAQDGSPTWHGPGFIDSDGDGICDRWVNGNGGPDNVRR